MAGIYIHVPFCKTRCIYCDFYSTTRNDLKRRYVQALCKELSMRRDYLKGESVETVYLGGGTPSQLDEEDLTAIFDTLQEVYGLEHAQEITFEANPDDLTEDYVAMLRRFPINRISMGIQTFDDATLRLLHRRHTAQEAKDAVCRCKKAGLQNISLDLIYGLPGQTEEMWANDIRTAIALRPKHLSAYMLTYELNSMRNTDATIDENMLPTHFTWSNYFSPGQGQNTIAAGNGVPNIIVYGGRTYSRLFGSQDWKDTDFGWMQGYDKWYSAMFNRTTNTISDKTSEKVTYSFDGKIWKKFLYSTAYNKEDPINNNQVYLSRDVPSPLDTLEEYYTGKCFFH